MQTWRLLFAIFSKATFGLNAVYDLDGISKVQSSS